MSTVFKEISTEPDLEYKTTGFGTLFPSFGDYPINMGVILNIITCLLIPNSKKDI